MSGVAMGRLLGKSRAIFLYANWHFRCNSSRQGKCLNVVSLQCTCRLEAGRRRGDHPKRICGRPNRELAGDQIKNWQNMYYYIFVVVHMRERCRSKMGRPSLKNWRATNPRTGRRPSHVRRGNGTSLRQIASGPLGTPCR